MKSRSMETEKEVAQHCNILVAVFSRSCKNSYIVRRMIFGKSLNAVEITKVTSCSDRTVQTTAGFTMFGHLAKRERDSLCLEATIAR